MAFDGNNIGITICFLLFLGPLTYLYLKGTPIGSVFITIAIGSACYLWGYLKGIDKGKKEK